MPNNSAAVDFFQLFVVNHILGNIQCTLGNKSLCTPVIGSWNELSLEELRGLFRTSYWTSYCWVSDLA